MRPAAFPLAALPQSASRCTPAPARCRAWLGSPRARPGPHRPMLWSGSAARLAPETASPRGALRVGVGGRARGCTGRPRAVRKRPRTMLLRRTAHGALEHATAASSPGCRSGSVSLLPIGARRRPNGQQISLVHEAKLGDDAVSSSSSAPSPAHGARRAAIVASSTPRRRRAVGASRWIAQDGKGAKRVEERGAVVPSIPLDVRLHDCAISCGRAGRGASRRGDSEW